MANYGQPPIYLSAYLRDRAQKAMAAIAALTKSDLSKDPKAISSFIITNHQVTPLTLGKSKATIPENHPNQVLIKWHVTGDIKLLCMPGDDNYHLNPKAVNGSDITESLNYPAALSENEYNRNAAKQAIEQSTKLYQKLVDRVNTKVEEHNQLLLDKVPNSVSLKFEALNKLKAAEDFLN